jgi:hypothetical protein
MATLFNPNRKRICTRRSSTKRKWQEYTQAKNLAPDLSMEKQTTRGILSTILQQTKSHVEFPTSSKNLSSKSKRPPTVYLQERTERKYILPAGAPNFRYMAR